jgi:hypothetical protein
MTPKEKAIELVTKFLTYSNQFYPDDTRDSKQCALIAVNEILDNNLWFNDEINNNYWQEVKQEIELL